MRSDPPLSSPPTASQTPRTTSTTASIEEEPHSSAADDSHGTVIDPRLPTKHATADILDLSLKNTLFRFTHSKAYEVAIRQTEFRSDRDK
jgi:hypothetical protein